MTLIIKCYQAHGVKTKELVDVFEFCCWVKLESWLKQPKLHSCNNHQNVIQKNPEEVKS